MFFSTGKAFILHASLSDNVRHCLTDRGVTKEHRERIIGVLFGSEGAVVSGDESTYKFKACICMSYSLFV